MTHVPGMDISATKAVVVMTDTTSYDALLMGNCLVYDRYYLSAACHNVASGVPTFRHFVDRDSGYVSRCVDSFCTPQGRGLRISVTLCQVISAPARTALPNTYHNVLLGSLTPRGRSPRHMSLHNNTMSQLGIRRSEICHDMSLCHDSA